MISKALTSSRRLRGQLFEEKQAWSRSGAIGGNSLRHRPMLLAAKSSQGSCRWRLLLSLADQAPGTGQQLAQLLEREVSSHRELQLLH